MPVHDYSLTDYEYQLLTYLRSSPAPVSLIEITTKLGEGGKAITIHLYRRRLVTPVSSTSSGGFFDDADPVKLTPDGEAAAASYHRTSQLKTRELWANRIWSFLIGVATSSAVWFLTIVLPELLRQG